MIAARPRALGRTVLGCPTFVTRKAVHAAPRKCLARSATGPGSMFDESPTEPVSDEEKKISAQLMDQMKEKISAALETDQVTVKDIYGNSQHVSIDVVSALFDGKTSVQRQRMVYKAIWMELQDLVHAVDSMSCKTPDE